MDQVKEIPRVLLLTQPDSDEKSASWQRFAKALKGISQLEHLPETRTLNPTALLELTQGYDQVFLDIALVDFAAFGKETVPNAVFVSPETFAWNTREAKIHLSAALGRHPCVVLEHLSASDLIRTLHLMLMTKRLAGVTPMMEKGSLVVGEKIQSLEGVGTMLDKLCAFIDHTDDFSLKARVPDLRQVLSAILAEAFRQAEAAMHAYPTVDFQVGLNKAKMTVNLRFPIGNLKIAELPAIMLEGRDLFWQQIWLCSDLLLLTHHTQYDELELMLLIHRPQRPQTQHFRSLLTKVSDKSMKKENMLAGAPNFDFRVLSEVRLKEQEIIPNSLEQESSDIDLGSLPDTVVNKLVRLSEESEFLRERNTKKDALFQAAQGKLLQFTKELSQKKSDLVRLAKAAESQIDTLKRKVVSLEKVALKKSEVQQQAAAVESHSSTAANESIAKLEQALKALENEKLQLLARTAKEEKKVAVLEQKYSALYRDLGIKDKEISELKALALKTKKDIAAHKSDSPTSAVTNAAADAMNAKLKESDSRELALKTELRKLAFKIENHDKNVKAIQQEAAEKTKLLEQKLQGAKAKELEFLKKIEELSAALKKAAKAA